MILLNLFFFVLSLFVLIKSSQYCVVHASRVARIFHLTEFVISFFIVAVISILPETVLSIISSINGHPEFGLALLFSSNVADLTLVFGLAALFSINGIRIKSNILRADFIYLLLLIFPVLLGMDGSYSRIDGILLVAGGLFFYLTLSIESHLFRKEWNHIQHKALAKNFALLVLFLFLLGASAHYTIHYATVFAGEANIPAILIAISIIAVGSCLPELIFSLKAVMTNHEQLALGDVLGTVITDATIVLGIVVLIRPFAFPLQLVYFTGVCMFIAAVLAIVFIRTDRTLSKKEGLYLLLFYLMYILIEFYLRLAK